MIHKHLFLTNSIQILGLCSSYWVVVCHPQLNTKMQHPNKWFCNTTSLLRAWPFLEGRAGHFETHRVIRIESGMGFDYFSATPSTSTNIFLRTSADFLSNSWQFSKDFQRFSRFSPLIEILLVSPFSGASCGVNAWHLGFDHHRLVWLHLQRHRVAGGSNIFQTCLVFAGFEVILEYIWYIHDLVVFF